MAATSSRASSLLPSIKCSQCSVEIPISHMGDHVCSTVPALQSASNTMDTGSSSAALPKSNSRTRTLDGPFAPSPQGPMGPAPPTLRSGKAPPIRSNTIDSSLSARPMSGSTLRKAVPVEEIQPPPRLPLSSNSTLSSSQRTSLVSSRSGRKSPHRNLVRVATAPLAERSPSPDATPLPQDSAFPIFPTARSKTATPTTPHKTTFGFLPETKGDESTHDVLPSSRPHGDQEEILLNQSNSSILGPVNAQSMEVRHPSGADGISAVTKGHGSTRSASTDTARSRIRALSTTSSNYTRIPSMSSIAGYTRLDLVESDVPAVPTVPSVALDYDTLPTPDEEPTKGYISDASPFNFGSFGQSTSAHTIPEDGRREESSIRPSGHTHTSTVQEQQGVSKTPSESPEKNHKSKPSVMLPLYDIGSTSSFRPSKSLRGRRNGSPIVGQLDVGQTKATNPQEDKRLDDAPPMPQLLTSQSYETTNPYHTPHESVSSNDSYGSGVKSGSSRSSPPLNSPLNDLSPQQKGQFGSDGFNDAFQGFQFGVEGQTEDQRRNSQEGTVPATATPQAPIQQYTLVGSQASSLPALSDPPPSVRPTSPLHSQQQSSPILSRSPPSVRPVQPAPAPLRNFPMRPTVSPTGSPEGYLASPASPYTDLTSNTGLSVGVPRPPPIPEAPAKKRTPTSKGQCRGCNTAIYGKSISSADGQLTGRYHKQCFVCKTCRAPFQTTDFYVHNNNPYCGRHYHEQNGSLCTNCDRGIEGQYLETDRRQKFHPYCFTCQECHRILRDDFFEWNNRILCEQHAFGDAQRAALQPSSLGPGRRYPERRTTRLMIM